MVTAFLRRRFSPVAILRAHAEQLHALACMLEELAHGDAPRANLYRSYAELARRVARLLRTELPPG